MQFDPALLPSKHTELLLSVTAQKLFWGGWCFRGGCSVGMTCVWICFTKSLHQSISVTVEMYQVFDVSQTFSLGGSLLVIHVAQLHAEGAVRVQLPLLSFLTLDTILGKMSRVGWPQLTAKVPL